MFQDSGLSSIALRDRPPHIHVEHSEKTAKLWIDPVELAGSRGFRAHELNRLRAMVIEHRLVFKDAWNEHFGPKV